MNDSLTKELKEVGFPQGSQQWKIDELKEAEKTNDKTVLETWEEMYGIKSSSDIKAYKPTLSELIEACGERFAMLGQQKGVWCAYDKWYNDIESISNTVTRSKTPQEAVAKLYIALNK